MCKSHTLSFHYCSHWIFCSSHCFPFLSIDLSFFWYRCLTWITICKARTSGVKTSSADLETNGKCSSHSLQCLLAVITTSGFLIGAFDALIAAAAGGQEADGLAAAFAAVIVFSFSATLLTFASVVFSARVCCVADS